MPSSDSLLDGVRLLIGLASELGDTACESLACELSEQIAGDDLNLFVAGQFKRGKSSLVNALLGADLMPTGALPLTGVATSIRYGDAPSVEVVMRHEPGKQSVPPADIALYVTEQFNPGNRLGVERVDVTWPSECLRGVTLFDAPGVGSTFEHNTAAAFAALPHADAAILVVGPEPPVGFEELEYAREVVASSEKLFVVLNKSDLAGESLTEMLEFTRRAVARALSIEVDVLPISATQARSAQKAGLTDAEFERFVATVRGFVAESGRAARSASLRRRVLRIVERLDVLAYLRLSTLRMPAEERRRRREALETALQIVDDRARPLELALDDDVNRLQLRLEDRLDRLHDRDALAFGANDRKLASLRSRGEREKLFERLLAEVVDAWRTEILAQADVELRICAEKYTRLTGEIERSIWKAGLEAARLDLSALVASDIAFAPANLKLVASLVPTTGLELLIGFAVDILPSSLRRGVLARRYRTTLQSELDAARGKLRYGIARDLDPWRRSVRDVINASLRDARNIVLGAFEETEARPDTDEDHASQLIEDARRRLGSIRAGVEKAVAA